VDAITSSDKGQRVRAGKSIWPQWPLLLYYWVSLYTRRPSPAYFPTPPAGATFGHSGGGLTVLKKKGSVHIVTTALAHTACQVGPSPHIAYPPCSCSCSPSWFDLGFHTAASSRPGVRSILRTDCGAAPSTASHCPPTRMSREDSCKAHRIRSCLALIHIDLM